MRGHHVLQMTVICPKKFLRVLQSFASNNDSRYFLIQFWEESVGEDSLHHLITWDLPFALWKWKLTKGLCEYRKRCMGYGYSMDEDVDEGSRGPIGRVFRSWVPEISPNIRLYSEKEHPLRDDAVRYGFEGSYGAVPVFHCSGGDKPVAVLELLTGWPIVKDDLNRLQRALKEEGFYSTLSLPCMQPTPTPTYVQALENDFMEVTQWAIDSVPELHLALLWLPPISSDNPTLNNLICMETSSRTATDIFHKSNFPMKSFIESSRIHKVKSNIWIVGHKFWPMNSSFFCRNIGNLSISVYPLAHYAQRCGLSFCFAVCLRNREDGNKTCVIEFFLQFDSRQDQNPFHILKFLLKIIDIKLQGYELSSGKSICTEMPFELPTESNVLTSFPVDRPNISSPVHEISQCAHSIGPQNSKKLAIITKMAGRYEDLSLSVIEAFFTADKFIIDVRIEEEEGECIEEERSKWKKWDGKEEHRRSFIFSSLECPLHDEIQHKIKLCLRTLMLHFNSLRCLIQFWAVKQSYEKSYLVTIDQPFALIAPVKGLYEYRKRSMDHQYLVNDGVKEDELGPPGRVYTSKCPEWTTELRIYSTREFPLRDYAIQCGLRYYWAFPIELLNRNGCVGVLEFIGYKSSYRDDLRYYMDNLRVAFKKANLRATHIGHPYCEDDAHNRIFAHIDEVKEMVDLVYEIPQLRKVKLWVPCTQCPDNENCMQFEDYSKDMHRKVINRKGIIGTVLASESKLCFFENLLDFNITEEPQILKARRSGLNVCLAICLQSSHTGNLHVIEFFLDQSCKRSENLNKFLSCLLPIMKEELKSFKVASGREFGEELVIEVVTFGKISEFGSLEPHEPNAPPIRFKIFQYGEKIDGLQTNGYQGVQDDGCEDLGSGGDAVEGEQNNISLMNLDEDGANHSKKRNRRSITLQDLEPHIGKKMDAVKNLLGVSRSTIQRVCRDYGIPEWPSDSKDEKNIALFRAVLFRNSKGQDFHGSSSKNPPPTTAPQHILGTNTTERAENVTIKAKFNNDTVRIQLNISSKLEKLKQEVARRFNMETRTFKLKYWENDKELILLGCDDDLHDWMKSLKESGKTLDYIIVESV